MKLTCMQDHQDDKVIVYFLTCASVDFFHSALTQLPDMKAAQLFALHGKMKQAAREAVMSSYTGSPAGMTNTSAVHRMYNILTLPDRLLHASNNVCTAVVLCILLAAAYGQSFFPPRFIPVSLHLFWQHHRCNVNKLEAVAHGHAVILVCHLSV